MKQVSATRASELILIYNSRSDDIKGKVQLTQRRCPWYWLGLKIAFAGPECSLVKNDHYEAVKWIKEHKERSIVFRFAKGLQAGHDGVPPDAETWVVVKKTAHGGPGEEPWITCSLRWRAKEG